MFAFEMLRSRAFPIDDLTAWTKRATTYLGRVLDDGFSRLALNDASARQSRAEGAD